MSDSLERLYQAVIVARDLDPATSRTARLFQRGPSKMAKKLAEEAIEVVIDAVNGKTDAVIREFAARSRMRVSPGEGIRPDVVVHGTILNEVVAPLTYNTTTQQSSSFLITLVISVTVNDRDGKVLYENKNYVFRGQYQSTTDLPTFLDESPAAVERISRDFARALVADVLEGL